VIGLGWVAMHLRDSVAVVVTYVIEACTRLH
jgi:hypothetical protein